MSSIVGLVVAAVAAAGLAVGTAFGIVSAASETPAPVDSPLVVYGER